MGDRFLLSATVANVDYFALGAIYFLEYETKEYAEQAAVKPFWKTPVMPETVAGSIRFAHKRLNVSFEQTETGLHMTVRSKNFRGRRLAADIEIERTQAHETLNVVVPWNSRTFQFTSKQQCLPASGTVVWGDETYAFESDTAFACLDYGRGIWPYCTSWNWATLSGRSGDDVFGINLGAKWTDNTGMNENGIFLNGKMHKISDDVIFHYDDKDFMRPWRIETASSEAVDLTLVPFYDKGLAVNLIVLRSRSHQVFGHYSGTLKVGDRTVRVENIPGWAEEHVARW